MSVNRLPEQSCPVFNKLTRHEPVIQWKNQHLVGGQLQKILDLDELLTWAYDMVTWYWSADTLFWQVSVDHDMDVQYQRRTVNQGCMSLCQPVIWSMAAMLCNSVVTVVRTRPRAILLAMITMRKSTHGFPFVSHIWDACGAPLGGPWGRQSSAIKCHIPNQSETTKSVAWIWIQR